MALVQGGHFLVADTSPLGMKGTECARFLLKEAKVRISPRLSLVKSVFFWRRQLDGVRDSC